MAVNINRVIIAGNLTRDPQVRFFANEKAVADIGLAVNRRYRSADGEQKEEVTFIDVECWERTAELVGQYLTKGKPCLVEGRLKLDAWEDKDGNKRQKLKVVAERVHFLDSRGAAAPAASGGEEDGAPSPAPARRRADAPVSSGPGPQAAPGGAAPADDEPPF